MRIFQTANFCLLNRRLLLFRLLDAKNGKHAKKYVPNTYSLNT